MKLSYLSPTTGAPSPGRLLLLTPLLSIFPATVECSLLFVFFGIILIFLLKAKFAVKQCPVAINLLLIYSSNHYPIFFSDSFLHPTLIVTHTKKASYKASVYLGILLSK
mgnify:CR=1 FL=1